MANSYPDMEKKDPYKEGYRAADFGMLKQCPYDKGTVDRMRWESGYSQGKHNKKYRDENDD